MGRVVFSCLAAMSARLKPNAPKSVELLLPVTMLPEGVPGVMVMPFGNDPETGMSFGMLAENCGARAARAGVASLRLILNTEDQDTPR